MAIGSKEYKGATSGALAQYVDKLIKKKREKPIQSAPVEFEEDAPTSSSVLGADVSKFTQDMPKKKKK